MQGLPTAITPEGISFVTTLPAPISESSPILTFGNMITFAPIHTLFPIVFFHGPRTSNYDWRKKSHLFQYSCHNHNKMGKKIMGLPLMIPIFFFNSAPRSSNDLIGSWCIENKDVYILPVLILVLHFCSDYTTIL